MLSFVTACGIAHKRTIVGDAPATPDGVEIVENEDVSDVELKPSPKEEDEEETAQVPTEKLDESKITLKNYPDVPHNYNRHVQMWLDYFQGRGKPHMEKYLERSTRYLPLMRKILKENGLPEDLVYIALIESGFGHSARSHAGAVGYWQFISETGRRYNLQINSLIDERRDPIKATYAAVRYFRSLYNVFGNWYFAFAAYNGGENRMFRVLMKHDSRDYWTIADTRLLPKETRNYIPKYLAARMIAKNPERYGFSNLNFSDALNYAEVVASQTVNLKTFSEELGADFEEIQNLNPMFTTEFAPSFDGKSITLRVPTKFAEKAPLAIAKAYVTDTRMIAAVKSNEYYRYRVRRGDNLSVIARRHGTSVANIKRLNRLGSKNFVRIGQYLKVPDRNNSKKMLNDLRRSLKDTRQATKDNRGSRFIRKNKKQHYVVRRGDTLTRIAKKHNVTLSKLLAVNELRRSSKLNAGIRLVIP